eukprot:GCRY01007543.1.p1 GENE.GCRY01007543.1~~GCRY01007543.1.p1  ORF type:complete len:371 (+),score=43.98 GCRY01007543.1:204-1316(+)
MGSSPQGTVAANARRGLGIFLIFTVVFLWVASSTLIQYILVDSSYHKPIFLTYYNTSLFSLYLFGFFFLKKWRVLFSNFLSSLGKTNESRLTINSCESQPLLRESKTDQTDFKHLILIALGFCPLWFLANVSFNLSLGLTSVASNTVLSSTSSIFTLIVGVCARQEQFSVYKLFSIVLTFGGTVLIALTDRSAEGANTLMGDVWALLGALFYGFYMVYCKWTNPDGSRFPMGILFGLMGFFSAVLFAPLIYTANVFDLERFEFPAWKIIGYLTLNGCVGTVLSDFLTAHAQIYTSPLTTTIGITLTVPLSMLVDYVWKGLTYSPLYVCGAVLIIFSFVVIAFLENMANHEGKSPSQSSDGVAGKVNNGDH